jgi:hypothetical protein
MSAEAQFLVDGMVGEIRGGLLGLGFELMNSLKVEEDSRSWLEPNQRWFFSLDF